MKFWLMKSEPSCFSIDDLLNMANKTTSWDGVRNYQARNFMRNQMTIGDQVFFYHSNCPHPGIVGIVEVISEAYPDHTAFDPNSDHPDPKSSPANPRWSMVDVRFKEKFNHKITLDALRQHAALAEMPLLRPGNRLSVLPLTAAEWQFINTLEKNCL